MTLVCIHRFISPLVFVICAFYEHDAFYLWQRLENRQASDGRALFFAQGKIFEAVGVKRVPELIPGVGRGEFGEQTALAVSDDHHLLECQILAVGIERKNLVGDGFPKFCSRHDDRLTAAVEIHPNLKPFADFGIGFERVEHFAPPNGTGKGAMDKENRNLPRRIRLHRN